jgi:catechol 2,3-dioxygenase-like lactoylglutathione lyase family enzyme
MKLRKIDHVGIVVHDMAAAKAFFLALGFELSGEGIAEGEWVESVIGIRDVKVAYAMIRTPDSGANIELIQFHKPLSEKDNPQAPANTLGLRHLALVVEDIEAVVETLKPHGAELIGRIQDIGSYKLCYIRGPEGIILELAEELN